MFWVEHSSKLVVYRNKTNEMLRERSHAALLPPFGEQPFGWWSTIVRAKSNSRDSWMRLFWVPANLQHHSGSQSISIIRFGFTVPWDILYLSSESRIPFNSTRWNLPWRNRTYPHRSSRPSFPSKSQHQLVPNSLFRWQVRLVWENSLQL